jgi:hypothetical protein
MHADRRCCCCLLSHVQAKEELCYVSTDFDKEMKQTRYKDSSTPSIVREFVLPDYKSVMKGYARDPADTINNNIKNRQVHFIELSQYHTLASLVSTVVP